jgi:putative FmdB family regulatory protein
VKEGSVPTYQYTCTECGEPVEAVQRFSDEPLTVCSACGGRLRKVFSPVGIVFKGSGFYRTDSRKNATSPVAAEKPSGDSGSSSSSTSDESGSSNGSADKPAAKKAETASTSSKSSSSSSSSSSEKVA